MWEGYELLLYDLYGMMLPSDNDAAFQIAQVGGSLTLMRKAEGTSEGQQSTSVHLSDMT